VNELFEKHGRKAFEMAKKVTLTQAIKYKPVLGAIRYFIEESWYGVQHSSLISLTCEAVGGKGEDAIQIGAAMVLLGGAVDIHDDIIDKSKTKGSKLTVLGKFGEDLALLTGDALLFKGLTLLHEGSKKLSAKKRRMIIDLTEQAFFELGSAEAKEIEYRGKLDLSPKEYFEIIEMKASIVEAQAKIGAVIGGGTQTEIDALGQYGRTLGILTTIRDDFIDMFEPDELMNRFRNECLPVPLLFALQNKKIKDEIIPILQKQEITEEQAYALAELVYKARKVQNLRKKLDLLMKETLEALSFIKVHEKLELILHAAMEDL